MCFIRVDKGGISAFFMNEEPEFLVDAALEEAEEVDVVLI
jgi:hypothetical protein